MIRLLLVFLFMTGCGRYTPVDNISTTGNVDEDVNLIIRTYLDDKAFFLGTRGASYTIKVSYADLDPPYIGLCSKTKDPFKKRNVYLDRKYLDRASFDDIRILIYHEMGHCDLNLPHQDEVVGIMNTKKSTQVINEEVIEAFFKKGL